MVFYMKKRCFLFLILVTLLLFVVTGISPGYAEQDPGAVASSAQVYVSGLTLDPEVLMPWDTGTVTIEITNSGTQGVPISAARLHDNKIKTLSNQYDVVGSLGGGNTMKFAYTIQADGTEGIYYPVFSLDFRDAGYLRYPFEVKVQDKPLSVGVLDKPETFTSGKKEILTLHIGNPRDNRITGLTISPEGGGHEISPTSFFVGVLESDSSIDVPFSVTPGSDSDVNFTVQYQNGINEHEVIYAVPVTMGQSKMRADPVLSNIILEDTGEYYRLSGDVTNSGLENANGVVITTGEPAVPTIPYRLYAVGALKPDDFAGFEITFTTPPDLETVTVLISYKDDDGNEFVKSTEVNLDNQPQSGKTESTDLTPVFIGIAVIVILAIGGIIYYTRFRR